MKKVSWGFVAAGFGSLLTAAYYDNIRGPLLPPMATELGLAYEDSGWFLGLGYVAATISTLILLRALNHFSERAVMMAATALGLLAALVGTQVSGIPSLMLLALIGGAAVSNLGTMSNVLVMEGAPPESAGRFLSGLHAMFGIGSMAATAAVGIGIGNGMHWSSFYAAGAPLVLALMVGSALVLTRRGERIERTVQAMSLTPLQVLVVVTFGIYVAAEVSGVTWMTSYLVNERGMTVATAAPYVTAYFLVMTLSRLTSAAWIRPQYERLVLGSVLILPILAYVAAHAGANWTLALVGLYGPFFPVFLSQIRRAFPDKWRSITLWTVVSMNVSIGLTHVVLGGLADHIGIENAYYVPMILLMVAGLLLVLCFRKLDARS